MISDDIINTVYRKHADRVFLNDVRSILELFEETQANKSKVFIQNSYNNNNETFNSLEQAIQYINDLILDYGWDKYQIADYLTVFVGRPVALKVKQVTTVKFS